MRDACPYPCRSVREPSPKGLGARGYLQLHKFECPRARYPEAPQCARCEKTKSPVFCPHPDPSSGCFNTLTGPPRLLEIRLAPIAVSIRPSLEGFLQGVRQSTQAAVGGGTLG